MRNVWVTIYSDIFILYGGVILRSESTPCIFCSYFVPISSGKVIVIIASCLKSFGVNLPSIIGISSATAKMGMVVLSIKPVSALKILFIIEMLWAELLVGIIVKFKN